MTARARYWVVMVLLVLLVLVTALGNSPATASSDTTAPTLTGLSFSPQPLDTTNGPAHLTVTIRARDDLSGLASRGSWAYVEFRWSPQTTNLSGSISGPASTTAIVQFPRYSRAGTWHISIVRLLDNADNMREYTEADLQALGFPTTIQVVSKSDTTPPTLTSLSFSPQSLDTVNGPANLTVTIQATDDLSGLASTDSWAKVVFSLTPESTSGIYGFIYDPASTTTTLEFPRYSRTGTWHISSVILSDNVGNLHIYSEADLQALGFPTTIEMVGSSDDTAPALTSLSFSPQSLDTVNGPANLTVTIQATDDLSGLKSSEPWVTVLLRHTPESYSTQLVGQISDPESTTTILQFPQRSTAGTWHVFSLILRDNALNERTYSEADLQALGFPTTIQVNFADVPYSSPYYTQINALTGLGIVNGFGNGTFGPNNLVTRQQFAKMMVRTLNLPVSENDKSSFTDVGSNLDPKDPFYPDHYVAVCAAYGITEGITPLTFAPYSNLTRAQLITMVARAANLPDPPDDYSPVFGNFSATHYPWARKAAYAGLLDGLQGMGKNYDFWASATRGEVCVMLYNLVNRW